MLDVDPVLLAKARALADSDSRLLHQLRELRLAQGLSQTTVAKRLGVTQPAIAAFEAHDSNPTLAALRRYALAIGAHVDHVVTVAQGDSAALSFEGQSER
jgi:transcriptional regulator with XRE-family HTH domain